MTALAPAAGPGRALLRRMNRPAVLIVLFAAIWLPLLAYVLSDGAAAARGSLLLAMPAVLLLYLVLLVAWRESRIAQVGLSMVAFWVLVAVSVPYLGLIDPNKPIAPFALPWTEKAGHFFPLGADLKGRDMLARTLWGCQRVLVWGVSATAIAYAIGALLGLVAGYLGGWWDQAISLVANVILSFPVMVLFILILNYIGASGFNVIVAVTFASSPAIMRIVRGLTLDLRTREFVAAAQTRGESPLRIMLVEILPNARGPLIVDACLRLGYTTVAITTLTFLGLGLQPPDADWGLMIREAAKAALLWKFSYMLMIPALAVSSLILGFNLMADGLREMSLKD
jgi:peptide/nickel transport system permease protein